MKLISLENMKTLLGKYKEIFLKDLAESDEVFNLFEEPITHTISISYNDAEAELKSGSTNNIVNDDSDLTITATALPGYYITQVLYDGIPVELPELPASSGTEVSFTMKFISADHTVEFVTSNTI